MGQNITGGRQKLVATGHVSSHFKLEDIQVDVSQDSVLCKSDERVYYRIREDVCAHFRVVTYVGYKFVIRHEITTVTEPTTP